MKATLYRNIVILVYVLLLPVIGWAQQETTTIPSYVPNNGLVAWYPFNGNANDNSGYNNNGTVNGATLTLDRLGNSNSAYSFNGTSDYIFVPNSSTLNLNNFTLSLWVSSTSTLLQVALKQNNYTTAANEKFSFALNNYSTSSPVGISAKYGSSCNPGQGWQSSNSSNNILDGSYHHLVGVVSNDTIRLYIDGSLVNTTIVPIAQSDNCYGGDIQIGREWLAGPNYFNGRIDDVGIWRRALSNAEIARLYGAAGCTTPPTPTISGNTTFCPDASTVLTSSFAIGNLWSTGDTTRAITVNIAGNYTVRAISGVCTSAISDTFRVFTNLQP